MVMVWGYKERPEPNGVTGRDQYTCPTCNYKGRLLLYVMKGRRTAYWVIPMGRWRSMAGVMVCPACGHRFELSNRKYRKLDKLTAGSLLVDALRDVDAEVERQFPRRSPR